MTDQDTMAELYARLMPYILRDFSTRTDLINLLLFNAGINALKFIDNADYTEGIKRASYYKELLETGADDLINKIKPVIEI